MPKNRSYFTNRESSGDAQIQKLKTLQGTAAPEPDQGARTPDSGAGGCASLEGRGTMEKK